MSLADLKLHPRGLKETVITMTAEHSASISMFLIVRVIEQGFSALLALKGYTAGFVIAISVLALAFVLKSNED